MSKLPAMPFYVDAYIADTVHLTMEESGTYLQLLMAMWRRGGFIPDDDKDNARICRMDIRRFRRIKKRLMPLMLSTGPVDKRLSQKKLLSTWNLCIEKKQKMAELAKGRWKEKQGLSSSRRMAHAYAQSDATLTNKDIITSLQEADAQKPTTPSAVAAAPDGAAPALEKRNGDRLTNGFRSLHHVNRH